MPSTYTPISAQTVTSAVASVTFSSIPSTYTDLIMVCSVFTTTTTASVNVQFNNDTGSNYSYSVLDGDGTTSSSNRQTNTTAIQVAAWSSNLGSTLFPSPAILQVNNYSNTTTNKTALIRSTAYGATTNCVDAFVGLWRNTAAINTIKLSSSNFQIGSTFSLYGIKEA